MRQHRNSEDAELATERFRTALRARGLRWTGERKAIVQVLLARPGHFSIDTLLRDLRARGSSASRATVYRALPMLVEAGLVQPTRLPSQEQRYESAFGQVHHDHLRCQRCGKVVEFQFEAIEILQEAVAAKHGFELIGHVLELVGICTACKKSFANERASHAKPSHLQHSRARRRGPSRRASR